MASSLAPRCKPAMPAMPAAAPYRSSPQRQTLVVGKERHRRLVWIQRRVRSSHDDPGFFQDFCGSRFPSVFPGGLAVPTRCGVEQQAPQPCGRHGVVRSRVGSRRSTCRRRPPTLGTWCSRSVEASCGSRVPSVFRPCALDAAEVSCGVAGVPWQRSFNHGALNLCSMRSMRPWESVPSRPQAGPEGVHSIDARPRFSLCRPNATPRPIFRRPDRFSGHPTHFCATMCHDAPARA
jgi:hypothetical protein